MNRAFSEGPDYWGQAEVALPARSRLIHLEPAGVDTGFVESLASYSARLAAAHNVTHAALFGREISPLIDRRYLRNSESKLDRAAILAASFRSLARAVNGSGVTARDYAGALERLTGWDNLRCLTMTTWANVIPHRGLLKPSKLWCPSCFEESKAEKATVYEPLLWSLSVVSCCVRHSTRLRSLCPRCARPQPHLDSHSRPGFCSKCNGWLGLPPGTDELTAGDVGGEELERQTWVGGELCALLASSPLTDVAPPKGAVMGSIEFCIKNIPGMTESRFARAIGAPQTTVNDWRREGNIPELERSLRIARFTGIPLPDILSGHSRIKNFPSDAASSARLPQATGSTRPKGWRRQLDLEKVRAALESSLIAEDTPSVQEVARGLCCSRTALARHFPKECGRLSEKYKQRRKNGWSQIRDKIEAALAQDPPKSVRDIAKELSLHHTSLYRYFPELCGRVSRRYERYRRGRRENEKETFCREIREIVQTLYLAGIYPSVKQVEACLRRPKTIRHSKLALDALRQALDESGIPMAPNNFVRSFIS